MTEQKQIDEMQTVINCAFFADFKNGHSVCIKTISEHLYNAGYRKQIVGEWEQFGLQNPKCSLCRSYNIEKSNFCPNCGARMKEKENEKELS